MSRKIAQGTRCTWWGDFDETRPRQYPVGHLDVGTPTCPLCGGPVVACAAEIFWRSLTSEERRHPGTRDFNLWLRGKCYASTMLAHTAWKSQILKDGVAS